MRIETLYFLRSPSSDSYTLSLHDALPILLNKSNVPPPLARSPPRLAPLVPFTGARPDPARSEEHKSELQSRRDLVCRLLLEKKNDVRDWVPRKLAAVRCHRTQLGPSNPWA